MPVKGEAGNEDGGHSSTYEEDLTGCVRVLGLSPISVKNPAERF